MKTNISTIFNLHLYKVLLLLFFVFFQLSCNQQIENNALFDAAFDNAYKIFNTGQKQAALTYIDSVFNSQTHVTPFDLYRKYYYKKCTHYYTKAYDSNDVYTDSMLYTLEHYKIAGDHPSEYADALNAKADHYYQRNELNKAFEYYYRSKVIAESIKDSCALANQTYHLGMITYRQRKFNDAIRYFLLSFDQNGDCPGDSISFYRRQELYNNVGLSYTMIKQFDSAILYYNRAFDYINSEKKKFGPYINNFSEVANAVIYGNLAKIYAERKQYDSAKALLLKSIEINIKPGNDNGDALYAELDLAEVFANTEEYPAMFSMLQTVKTQLDTSANVPSDRISRFWNFLMYRYYQSQAQPAQAIRYLHTYMAIKDSIDVADKKLRQINIGQVLETQETQYQIALLKKDNQLSRLYLVITIGLSVLVILICLFIYLNYRRSKRNVKKLTLLNQRIREQKGQLQQAIDEKDRILYVVAHDLRDPIGGISFLSRSVLERESDESLKRHLSIILNTSQNSLSLISELLEFSNTARHEPPVPKDIIDINELAKQTATLMEFKALAKNQKINVTLHPKPLYVNVATEKILRANSNLVANAIKFSPQHTDIDIAIKQKDNSVLISITDTGIGIPQNLRPFVFDSFSSAKRSGTNGEKSFGLGLSICWQIVEAHDGNLWFESEEGKGTTFFMEFPIHRN